MFHWTTACKEAFTKLKSLLVSAPVLAYPQFRSSHPFILETDASIAGLGAVLAQQQEDGQVHPIAYSSRSLSVHERNYAITELETLGLVWATKIFCPYILGHRCVVFTDHAACTSLLSSSNPSSKLASWAMSIQELDLDIRHRSGKSNRVADALSRNPLPVANVLHFQSVHHPTESAEQPPESAEQPPGLVEQPPKSAGCESDVGRLQRNDDDLSLIFQYLEKDILPSDERQARRLAVEKPNFKVIDGVLYYENPAIPGCWRIAVPQSLRLRRVTEASLLSFFGKDLCHIVYKVLVEGDASRCETALQKLSCLCIEERPWESPASTTAINPCWRPLPHGWCRCSTASTFIQRKQVCHCIYGLLY